MTKFENDEAERMVASLKETTGALAAAGAFRKKPDTYVERNAMRPEQIAEKAAAYTHWLNGGEVEWIRDGSTLWREGKYTECWRDVWSADSVQVRIAKPPAPVVPWEGSVWIDDNGIARDEMAAGRRRITVREVVEGDCLDKLKGECRILGEMFDARGVEIDRLRAEVQAYTQWSSRLEKFVAGESPRPSDKEIVSSHPNASK